jgi:hypothetical protein
MLEVLEVRAVLTTLDDAPLADPLPLETPATPPVLESPTSDPATSADEGVPLDPTFDDPVIVEPVLQPPVVTSLTAHNENGWVWLTGSVADADGPVEGLTVYFIVGDGSTTVAFTATVLADGTFESAAYAIPAGTMIYAYTIDIDGNQSEIVNTIV